MTNSNLMALVFSDLHLNTWAKFNKDNSRTLNGFKVLDTIAKECTKKKVPAIFCGDLFHKPDNLDQNLFLLFSKWQERIYQEYPSFRCYAIAGNHDISEINTIEDPHFGWLEGYNNEHPFILVKPGKVYYLGLNTNLYGVPYIDHNVGLTKYLKKIPLSKNEHNILLLHTDYPGAKDTDDRLVDSVENLNINTLNRFDLVLCGHIHKPQRLSKKVYMIGAPLQQRRTDKNCQMGYWELYEDLKMVFHPLKGFPRFIDVESEDQVKDDGNYYTVLPKTPSKVENNSVKITKTLSKNALAHKYMKAKGIKDKKRTKLLANILKKAEQ